MKRYFNITLLRMFLTLVFITSLMLVSNYFVFRNSISGLYAQISENNELASKSIKQSFDACFKDIDSVINDINALPYEPRDTKGHSNLNMINVYMIDKNLRKIVSPFEYIDSVIIFFEDSDIAITSQGTCNFDEIFENKYINDKYAAEFWRNFAATKHSLKLIPSDVYSEKLDSRTKYNKRLIAVVGSNRVDSMKLNILIFIDVDKLLNNVSQQNMVKGSSLVILDQDKNVVLNIGAEFSFDIMKNEYFNPGNEATIQKGGYEYYYVNSDYNKFTYIIKIPYDFQNTLAVVKLNQIVLYFTILFSVIVSIFLSIYLYKPVSHILKLFGNKYGERALDNKYMQIYSGIKQIQTENEVLNKKINFVKQEVNRSIFLKMLDDIHVFNNLKDLEDTCFIDIFYSSRFFLVLFYIQAGAILEQNDGRNTSLPLPDNAETIIQETINKKFDNALTFCINKTQYAVLVGIKSDAKRDSILKNVQAVTDELNCSIFCEHSVAAAVSSFYSEIRDVRTAYREIKMSIAFKPIKSNKSVVDTEKKDYSQELYFPAETMEKISVSLLSGKYKECMDYINKIIDTNFDNNISSIKFINIMSSIFSRIVKDLASCGYGKNELIPIEEAFIENIDKTRSVEEIRFFFKSLIADAEKACSMCKQSKLDKESILSYLNTHYAEDLYLEKMAEIMNTTPKYFSNFFKKSFGISFIDYLNRIRLSHAKSFLDNQKLPIEVIGKRVGYSNLRTFAYTFKKHYGMTPTEYRRSNKHQL